VGIIEHMPPRPALPPSERLAADLRQQIDRGELQPGDQLPTVAALAKSYQVSTATVAKALRVLRDEGLIVTRHGWGTHVAEHPADS
jgi:DNA-binding GntR family transcriptional regulator